VNARDAAPGSLHRRCAVVLSAVLTCAPLAGAASAAEAPGAGAAAASALQWPWWHGPGCNGSGLGDPAEPLATPRIGWYATEFTKMATGCVAVRALQGGCQSLVMHADRIYAAFYIGSEDPVVLDAGLSNDKGWIDTYVKGYYLGHGHSRRRAVDGVAGSRCPPPGDRRRE
jgi:hypothetical protein